MADDASIVLSRRDAMVATILGILVPEGTAVASTQPGGLELPLIEYRNWPLGLWAQVEPGAMVQVEARPPYVFRGQCLIVPLFVASVFNLLDLRVGNWLQAYEDEPLDHPRRSFRTARGFIIPLPKMDTARPNDSILMNVENTSKESQTFLAAIVGTAVR